ncbi:uncharacterized protein LOC126759968 [Bactrocera neohumeralis]|uniref:uncharacterized protein LOC120775096 n=1 Tax=Bactrocera tryoni TaxID=59916 RepID=UPI001A9979C7|nr:uncharacterized protein LOC120775096 [Bactrocera tryoni]XP_050331223.1 uncharacterized protein LOC126759968 [Bactrocera neohumeralis]
MDTLFDQLKTETPANLKTAESTNIREFIKASKRSPSPESHTNLQTPNKIKKISTETKPLDNAAVRRESMPPPATTFVRKNISKSRSLSPPKGLIVRPFKVLLERKKIESSDCKNPKLTKASKTTTFTKKAADFTGSAVKNGEKSPKKSTPTKAQQKLFDPDVLVKAQQLTNFNVKRCKVRLLRQDLAKLKQEFHAKEKKQTQNKKSYLNSGKNNKSNRILPSEKSSNSKHGGICDEKESKHSAGFFIKINALTRSPKSKIKAEGFLKEKRLSQKLSAGTIAKKVNAAAAISSTKPTKFTRTHLIKMYGKRVFCSRVKIERCSHPMMLIFESNARARRLQAKRSKSKNLSVSFRDQVEIFGDSSDSEEADMSSVCDPDVASTSEAAMKSTNPVPISLTVTPARLKKVENGKVVDDIELDPSLFVVPVVSSTPFASPGKKKREKKSFSPLKGDGTPSPRKEQLKLANEKMPPSSLRRLTAAEVDEEDDEDDECEYIVPIEIPERRISRTSSANTMDDVVPEKTNEASNSDLEPTPIDAIDNTDTVQDTSGESFASAVDSPLPPSTNQSSNTEAEAMKNIENLTTTDKVIDEIKTIEDNKNVVGETIQQTIDVDLVELPQLTPIDSVSPSQSLNDIVNTFMCNENAVGSKEALQTMKDDIELSSNTNNISDLKTNDNQSPENICITDTKLRDTLDDDISLQLFVDDDTTANSNFLGDRAIEDSEIVDGIVKERIDEISKDKHLGSTVEATNLLSSKVTTE